jgi:hypothetical protein
MGNQKRHSGKKRIYGSRRSAAARAMFHLAVAFYRLGLVLAVLSLLAAASVVVAIPEPLEHRLMSVVFFGGIPSLAAWLGGWLVYLILNYASAACDDYISPIKTASGQFLLANAGGTRLFNGWNALHRCVGVIKISVQTCCRGIQWTAAAAPPSASLVYKILISYKHFFMAVTFPIRLVARICIAILPHEFSSAR